MFVPVSVMQILEYFPSWLASLYQWFDVQLTKIPANLTINLQADKGWLEHACICHLLPFHPLPWHTIPKQSLEGGNHINEVTSGCCPKCLSLTHLPLPVAVHSFCPSWMRAWTFFLEFHKTTHVGRL